MIWSPKEQGPIGTENDGFRCQIDAAEYLDGCLPNLFDSLPGNTIVILTADHGECFGENGYWGHGLNHPLIFEVHYQFSAWIDGLWMNKII